VRCGQPLRQAQQLCPQAAFVSIDGGDVERLRADVATALGALSPEVEAGDEESCCDLSGSHVAYPDEGRWAAAIARALVETLDGELPAIGVGSTRFVARMAALASEPRRVRRIPAGAEAAFLAPLPLGMLPVDPAIGARLAALGLDCLGAVANLSPVELQRQFGAEGLVLHRHCRGEDRHGGVHNQGQLKIKHSEDDCVGNHAEHTCKSLNDPTLQSLLYYVDVTGDARDDVTGSLPFVES